MFGLLKLVFNRCEGGGGGGGKILTLQTSNDSKAIEVMTRKAFVN